MLDSNPSAYSLGSADLDDTGVRKEREPRLHRLFFANGRVLRGEIYRAPESRLADHLTHLKGYVSVTKAYCETTKAELGYIAVNLATVIFVQEVAAER